MTAYEKARPEDRDEVIDFINLVFSMSHKPHDFKALLPKVYADGAPLYGSADHFIERTDGHIRACVAMLRIPMTVAGVPVTCGFIGSVSVHPYHRGHGSMRRLMAMAEDEAKRSGYTYMALGGQRQRYEYFGFSPAGTLASYGISNSNIRHALKDVDITGLSFKAVSEDNTEILDCIYALYQAQPISGSRKREDYLTICRSWFRELYAVLDGDVCIGGLIGNKNGLSEMLLKNQADAPRVIKTWMKARDAEEIKVRVETIDAERNRLLGQFAENISLEECCAVNVLDWPEMLRAYIALRQAWRPMPDGQWTFAVDELPSITITVHNGQADVSEKGLAPAARFSHLDAQRVIFSLMSMINPVQGVPEGWLPLPFYIPKADEY